MCGFNKLKVAKQQSFKKHWNLHMMLFNCKTLIISCFCCLVVCNNTSLCKMNRDNILHNQEQMANIIQRVLFTHLYNTLFFIFFVMFMLCFLRQWFWSVKIISNLLLTNKYINCVLCFVMVMIILIGNLKKHNSDFYVRPQGSKPMFSILNYLPFASIM